MLVVVNLWLLTYTSIRKGGGDPIPFRGLVRNFYGSWSKTKLNGPQCAVGGQFFRSFRAMDVGNNTDGAGVEVHDADNM